MDKHIDWILSLAASVRTKFYDNSIELNINKYLNECVFENKDTEENITVITNSILNGSAPFFIITSNPKKIYHNIISKLKTHLTEPDKCKFRPLTIITKLANREFIFDVGGNQLIYGISSKYADDNLVKSIICRSMYIIKNYFDYIDKDTNLMLPTSIEKIQNTTHSIHNGGRSNRKKQKITPRINVKVKILGKLIEYVKSNSIYMNSVIYLNELDSIDNHAMDTIYSDHRAKNGIIDYLKILIERDYQEYKFEINSHQQYFIPFDFRLRKLSCSIRNHKTNQTSYLINMYNTGSYEPIPIFKSLNSNEYQLMAHPLVRLRFLYLDKFLLNSKSTNPYATNLFNTVIQTMINTNINELANLQGNKPMWVGIHRDENYDKNQENMRANILLPYEVIII